MVILMVYKVAGQPGHVTSNVQCLTTNWNRGVMCQIDTPDVLRCPAYAKHEADGVGYKTIIGNINGFRYGWSLA